MNSPKIIIRVDGNFSIGLGHIYRGIALAEMLKDEFDVHFLLRSDSTFSPVKEAGFDYLVLPGDISTQEEPQWFNENIPRESLIILDGYEFKSVYQKAIKDFGFKLVYIDDLVREHMYADLVINHSPGIKPEDYSAEPYTRFALGLKYAILRPAFLEAAKQKREIDKIDTAFVCFGGADIYDLTLKATKALLQINQINKINVVVGAAYRHKEVYALQERQTRVNIFKNLSEKEMLAVMQECNFAIVPSSSILYEVLAVKMPVVTGFYVDNQQKIFIGLQKLDVFEGISDFKEITKEQLVKTLSNVIQINSIKKFINKQEQVVDNKIKTRYTLLINKLYV